MTRLAVFTTHPIQYQAPWFRMLSASRNLDVDVVFSYLPNAKQQGIGFDKSFQWDVPLLDGFRHHILKTVELPRQFPDFTRRIARGLGSLIDEIRPDAAMVLGWQEISLIQALVACKRRKIPIILRGESNGLRDRPAWVSQLHRRYFSLCDAFLAIGDANADLYRAAGVHGSRVIKAGYFVDNERLIAEASILDRERDLIRRAWSIPEHAVCFAFVGKLEAKKRPLDFLRALAAVRSGSSNIFGLLVGSGTEFDAAKRLALEEDLPVTFSGFLNQSEIARAYVAADALVLPSDYGETWGLVLNEAMACGCPTIVSNRVGASNDLVIDEKTGIVVEFGNVEAIANAMMRLSRDSRLLRTLGAEARNHVTKGYSIQRAVERTQDAVNLVLERRRATA